MMKINGAALPALVLASLLATAACGGGEDKDGDATRGAGTSNNSPNGNPGDAVIGNSGTVLTSDDSMTRADVGPTSTANPNGPSAVAPTVPPATGGTTTGPANPNTTPAATTNGAVGGPGSVGGAGSSSPTPPAPGTNSGRAGATTTNPSGTP